jgi:hypothetical protein
MKIVQLVKLEWNSNQDMLDHCNKLNISSTTSLTELNMKTISYLKDTMTKLLKKLLSSSLFLKVFMKVGTMLILRKEAIQISDIIDSEVWVLELDHAKFMKSH